MPTPTEDPKLMNREELAEALQETKDALAMPIHPDERVRLTRYLAALKRARKSSWSFDEVCALLDLKLWNVLETPGPTSDVVNLYEWSTRQRGLTTEVAARALTHLLNRRQVFVVVPHLNDRCLAPFYDAARQLNEANVADFDTKSSRHIRCWKAAASITFISKYEMTTGIRGARGLEQPAILIDPAVNSMG